ncbi:bis(5'-nucleosyl)-tetraphosphatase (symmetrical) YqeK [Chloroflexota bacterium]
MKDYFASLHMLDCVGSSVTKFLIEAGKLSTMTHCQQVAKQARELAAYLGLDDDKPAARAAWCHDLAAVVPVSEMLPLAESWNLPLTDSDRAIPMLLHGVIGAEAARRQLDINDEDALNAIRYHSTLRAGASTLEKAVFVADKIAVDPTSPRKDFVPLLKDALAAGQSIDELALIYLNWTVENGPDLGWVLHENVLAAQAYLRNGR